MQVNYGNHEINRNHIFQSIDVAFYVSIQAPLNK